MRKRRIFLIAMPALLAFIIIGIILLMRTPQTTSETPPVETPIEPTHPHILVVPETPLGPIAILVVFFLALLITQKSSKTKSP